MALPNSRVRFRVGIDFVQLRLAESHPISKEKKPVCLRVNFDHFRKLSTAFQGADANPIWRDFSSFEYETEQAHRLYRKYFDIEVLMKDQDSHVEASLGSISIDLQTLSLGPTEYELSLNRSSEIRLRLSVKMEQVSKIQLQFTNIAVKSLPAVEPFINPHGHVTFKEIETHQIDIESSESNKWSALTTLHAESTLKNLIDGEVNFDLYQVLVETSELIYIGYATVILRPFVSLGSQKIHHFRETINNRIASIGIIEGDISIQDVPTFAPLKEGLIKDDGLSSTATKLHSDLPDFNSTLFPRKTAHGTVFQ